MQWLRTWQRVWERCRRTPARRWLVAPLLLAVAASAAYHVLDGSQADLAASATHEHSIDHHGSGDPCCSDQSHTQDGICASADGCSHWMAAAPAPSFLSPDGELVQAEPAAAGSGAVPFSHFHPPKLFARV